MSVLFTHCLGAISRFTCMLVSLVQLIILTYILAVIWLVVFGFTAVPVLFFINMKSSCHKVNILSETTLFNQQSRVCMDPRMYGTSAPMCVCESVCIHDHDVCFFYVGFLPWNAVPGIVCGNTLANICKTQEVRWL